MIYCSCLLESYTSLNKTCEKRTINLLTFLISYNVFKIFKRDDNPVPLISIDIEIL